MPWHVRPSGVAFAIAAESGHATACPYNASDSLWLAIGAVMAACCRYRHQKSRQRWFCQSPMMVATMRREPP